MRSYGEIAGVSFQAKGFDIHNLAYHYRIRDGQRSASVYVNTMLELKTEINRFIKEDSDQWQTNY